MRPDENGRFGFNVKVFIKLSPSCFWVYFNVLFSLIINFSFKGRIWPEDACHSVQGSSRNTCKFMGTITGGGRGSGGEFESKTCSQKEKSGADTSRCICSAAWEQLAVGGVGGGLQIEQASWRRDMLAATSRVRKGLWRKWRLRREDWRMIIWSKSHSEQTLIRIWNKMYTKLKNLENRWYEIRRWTRTQN